MVLGLMFAVVLARGSIFKAIAMILLGLLLGQINTDVISGVPRYSFDIPELTDGIGFVAIAMGVFGFGEIISNLGMPAEHREVFTKDVKGLWPTRQDFINAWPAVLRGTALGSILGVLPGGGALLASFAAYTVEKKAPMKPGEIPFGQGNIRGVAGPESANNAGAQTSFIPMLTLGIPPNAVMALMIAAMTIHGITPGPKFLAEKPTLFWAMVASMWIGNLMLVILNLPLVGLWVRLLRVPYAYLFPVILTFCCIGVYSINYRLFDVLMMALFGVVGFILKRIGCEPAPMVLAFVLGPMLEEQFRRTLLLSDGDFTVFVTRPLAGSLLAVAAALVLLMSLSSLRARRNETFRE